MLVTGEFLKFPRPDKGLGGVWPSVVQSVHSPVFTLYLPSGMRPGYLFEPELRPFVWGEAGFRATGAPPVFRVFFTPATGSVRRNFRGGREVNGPAISPVAAYCRISTVIRRERSKKTIFEFTFCVIWRSASARHSINSTTLRSFT